MKKNRAIAIQIREELNFIGADLWNAADPYIQKILDRNFPEKEIPFTLAIEIFNTMKDIVDTAIEEWSIDSDIDTDELEAEMVLLKEYIVERAK